MYQYTKSVSTWLLGGSSSGNTSTTTPGMTGSGNNSSHHRNHSNSSHRTSASTSSHRRTRRARDTITTTTTTHDDLTRSNSNISRNSYTRRTATDTATANIVTTGSGASNNSQNNLNTSNSSSRGSKRNILLKGIGGNHRSNSHSNTTNTGNTRTNPNDNHHGTNHKNHRRTVANTNRQNDDNDPATTTTTTTTTTTLSPGGTSKKGAFHMNRAASFFSSSNHRNNNNNNNNDANTLHMFDETSSTGGIEVSLSHDKNHVPPTANNTSATAAATNRRGGYVSPTSTSTTFTTTTSTATTGGISTTNTINGAYTVVPPSSQNENLLSLFSNHYHERKKIYRAQFNPVIHPHSSSPTSSPKRSITNQTTTNIPRVSAANTSKKSILMPNINFQSRDHRIPLFTTNPNRTMTIATNIKDNMQYQDALHLLQSYNVIDELACIHDEIHNMNQEIIEINYDRHDIVSIYQEQQEHDEILNSHNGNENDNASNLYPTWDIHSQLLVRSTSSTRPTLTSEQRNVLQQQRGCHFTVYIPPPSPYRHNNKKTNTNNSAVIESLLSKCGSTNSVHTNHGSILGTNSFLSHIISLGNSPPKQNDGILGSNTFNSHYDNDDNNNNTVIHITTQTCREGGAGTTIQHLLLFPHGDDTDDDTIKGTIAQQHASKNATAVTKSLSSSVATPSFILSRDNAPTYHYGSLPQQLRQRIVQEQMRKNKAKSTKISPTYYMDNIIYLATGQYGTYYVEFRNSEKWWGIITNGQVDGHNTTGTANSNRIEADDEDEFNTICYDWDIHRIAFGPCTIQPRRSTHRTVSKSSEKEVVVVPSISLSWIIISKDGKVAWKNVPLRLHNCLSNRIASDSTPCEVSLGAHGSYFIRFIDGTCDWSLPAKTAQECQNLIRQGKTIQSISLHPDLSNHFIIRHSM